MKLFRRLMIGALLALGFAGPMLSADSAWAKKKNDPYNQRQILRYNEAFRIQLRYFTFNGAIITDRITDPIARTGSFVANFLDEQFVITVQYLVEINGTRVTVTPI